MTDSDKMFITMACSGRITEPKAKKSSTNVASTMISAIHGRVCPRLAKVSTSSAV